MEVISELDDPVDLLLLFRYYQELVFQIAKMDLQGSVDAAVAEVAVGWVVCEGFCWYFHSLKLTY